MFLRILLPIILTYLSEKEKGCNCMNSLLNRFAFFNSGKNMATSKPTNPLVGKNLSTDVLKVPLLTHKDETTSLGKLLSELPEGYKGLVLFLFPSAGTPGCTKQAINFTNHHKTFKEKGYEVYGLTGRENSPAAKWTEKHNLSFTTLLDRNMEVVDHLDCRKLVISVNRSHMVVSRDGKVLAFEKGVNAEGSAARVLELLEGL